MEFHQAEPNINFPVLRMASETWEMGVRSMLFGFRVSANPLGFNTYIIDYCGGDDPAFVLELFWVVYAILESLPEGVSHSDVSSLLPRTEIKPVKNDPSWPAIKQVAWALKNADARNM